MPPSYYSHIVLSACFLLHSLFLSLSMTVKLSSLSTIILIVVITSSLLHIAVVKSLGTASTIALTYSTPTACGIVAGEPTQRIQCYRNGRSISMQPNISFEAISGGLNFLCGLRSGGLAILCWDTADITQFSSLQPKRIYYSNTVRLTDLTVGDVQVCAREVSSGMVKCWRGVARRGSSFPSPGVDLRFSTIASGSGFTCGILMNNSRVHCWGNNDVGAEIERQFSNLTMLNLVAGESHACGLTRGGILVCKGSNSSRQLDVPFNSAFEFSGLAVGANFTCAVKQRNGLVTCWGKIDIFQLDSYVSENYSFELIVAGTNFLCGLTTSNLSMICWGTGWYNDLNHRNDLPLGMIIPGSCIQSSCSTCGMYPNSETLCGGSGSICKSCRIERPLALPLPPITPPPPPEEVQQALLVKSRNKLSLAFMIVGSVGAFAGISTIVYCLGGFLHKRYCNTGQPSITDVNVNTGASVNNHYIAQSARSFSIKSLGSTRLGFQRNGSSSRLAEKTQNFSLSELLAASKCFSLENKIGAGSFGTVYRGTLHGGREVAIKRGETGTKTRKFQEKESAFDSELALLPRLHHKHLLGLIGFCEENDERLLVYEYMSNGALYDHLHSKENTEKSSSILNSWKMRIKIALDAARGIEYLHNYAVPPIIHRDIKSSNILLDSNWTAKVSDFGLSLLGPESDQQFMSTRAVGTVGYIDPEYYVLNVLTAKSDVYGLGVVLLELLTGKRAVFRNDEDGAGPMAIVEYATPLIATGMLWSVLDERVGQPGTPETEAVELMAYTALHSVKLEGKERPNITDIVANLERALALCEEVHTSFCSTTLSIPSD